MTRTTTAAEDLAPRPRISIACDNGDCDSCCGWERAPFHGPNVYPCPCKKCTHPNAWTWRQAQDRELAHHDRAWIGDVVLERGMKPRRLEAWPGAEVRPIRLGIEVVTGGGPWRNTRTVRILVNKPTYDMARDLETAREIAASVGYTTV